MITNRRAFSFLLRLWPTQSGGESFWRASLQGVECEERFGFADLEGLLAFLRARISEGETVPLSAGHHCETEKEA